MAKVSIIGAGNVGATAAQFLAIEGMYDEIAIVDIKPGIAEGKALDIMQSTGLFFTNTKVIGATSNYEITKDSDVIVITSGIPRKPGQSREELVGINAEVVKSVLDSALQYSPTATFVIVSNPMDTMTYLAVKHLEGKVPAEKIIGMGGDLDSARFSTYIAEKLNVPVSDVDAFVIGGHGDKTMIPVVSMATVEVQTNTTEEKPITELLGDEDIEEIIQNTMKGGATLTGLLGTSAWQAPAAGITSLVIDLLGTEDRHHPCSVYNPDYDACIGVMCVISNGKAIAVPIEEYTEEDEREKFQKSLEAVKEVNKALNL